MPVLRLFASAREAAGEASAQIEAANVAELLDEARRRYGDGFRRVLASSRVWVNGQPADGSTPLSGSDVVAVLPPVSGGAARAATAPARDREAGSADRAEVPSFRPGAAPPFRPGPPPPFRPGPPPPRAARPASRAVPVAPHHDHADAPASALTRPLRLVAAPPAPTPDALARQPVVPGDAGTEARPEAGPEAERTSPPKREGGLPPLAVVQRSNRPHGRLGVAWAVATTVVTVVGPGWLALWFGACAAAAAAQASVVWRGRKERPLPAFAAATAAALPLAAALPQSVLVKATAMNGVVVLAVVAMLVARMLSHGRTPARDVALTLVIAVPVGLAAASPVLLRHYGVAPAVLLLAYAAAYDAGAYLVGTGASSTWEGPAAGIAALVPLTFGIAALNPVVTLDGKEPLILGALAAGLAPLGPLAGSALLGDRNAPAPALRRLDSLLLMGPLWSLCALAMS